MPFADYKDWDDCISKNKDKDNPEAYCGYIKNKVEESILIPYKSIYKSRDEFHEFVRFIDLYECGYLKEGLLPDWIIDRIEFIKALARSAKADFSDLLKAFKNKQIYKFFQQIGWEIEYLWELTKKGFRMYSILQKLIARKVQQSPVGEWTKEKLQELDEYLSKNPTIKSAGGILVAGLLIFIWMQMSFTGDFVYDFDLSSVILALAGKFTLMKFFGTVEGMRMLILFATGVLLGVSFPWPDASSIKYMTALAMSIFQYVKMKFHKTSDSQVEKEIDQLTN